MGGNWYIRDVSHEPYSDIATGHTGGSSFSYSFSGSSYIGDTTYAVRWEGDDGCVKETEIVQPGKCSYTVYVIDGVGNPVQGIQVNFRHTETQAVTTALTDSNGIAVMGDCRGGAVGTSDNFFVDMPDFSYSYSLLNGSNPLWCGQSLTMVATPRTVTPFWFGAYIWGDCSASQSGWMPGNSQCMFNLYGLVMDVYESNPNLPLYSNVLWDADDNWQCLGVSPIPGGGNCAGQCMSFGTPPTINDPHIHPGVSVSGTGTGNTITMDLPTMLLQDAGFDWRTQDCSPYTVRLTVYPASGRSVRGWYYDIGQDCVTESNYTIYPPNSGHSCQNVTNCSEWNIILKDNIWYQTTNGGSLAFTTNLCNLLNSNSTRNIQIGTNF